MKKENLDYWGFRLLLGFALVFAVSWTESGISGGVKTSRNAPADHIASDNPTETESKATFLAVGDIMLSRGVNRAIERAGDRLLPFSRLTEMFNAADFSFGNLESPISGNDSRKGKGLIFNAHRADVQGLAKYKFKVVDLANNHALDQGVAGMRYTLEYLKGLGIERIGVGEDKNEAWRGKVVTAEGIRIGFIGASYASYNDGGVTQNNYVARIEEIQSLRESIQRLKGESDFVIVAMHAGVEYTRRPHVSQVDFARAAIDNGADMVIGAHPHWIQTIEQYNGKYIFYSLGNFIFDQRQPGTRDGLLLRISVRRGRSEGSNSLRVFLDQVELVPVVIEDFAVPRRATETEASAILAKIGVSERILTPAR